MARETYEPDLNDPFDARIYNIGCWKQHENLRACQQEQKDLQKGRGGDWRACRNELKEFRECWRKWEESREKA